MLFNGVLTLGISVSIKEFKNISASDYEMNSVIDGFGWSMGLSLNEDRIYVSDGLHNQILFFDKLENIFLDRISL